MPTQSEKIIRFRQLHERQAVFVLANAWTPGSSKRLTRLGFEAIGTTSAGLALDLGVEDGTAGRDTTLANGAAILRATDLPVSADLGNGFGDSPKTCAETVRLAIGCGLAGGSIDDATGRAEDPIYPFDQAVARVRAAVEAATASGTGFVVTARAENFLYKREDLNDTIARLKAFQDVGADVLYGPSLPGLARIEAVCSALSKPVNVLMGVNAPALSLTNLERAGVRRLSLGSGLARAADAAALSVTSWIRDRGTFAYRSGIQAAFSDAG